MGVLTAVFVTADLVIATAWLPFLSVGFAVVGLLLAIVESLLPHESPLDEYMRRAGEPFARGLAEDGSTNWIQFDRPAPSGPDVNSVDLKGRRLSCVEFKYQPGYGIVNMRFFERKNDEHIVVQPRTAYRSGDSDTEGGWLTPDHAGEKGQTLWGLINGLWFAKHGKWGIVNFCAHRGDGWYWDGWRTKEPTDRDADLVSEPRVVKNILGVTTLRQANYGIIDAGFDDDVRIE